MARGGFRAGAGRPKRKSNPAPTAPVSVPDMPATAHAPETLIGKLVKAITPEPKPFRILVRTADGFESRPVTAEEAIAYCNGSHTWRRIG